MIKSPDVSILLPFYNAENTIHKAIKSILKQTFKNFELICVNNNSQDNSTEIVNKLAAKDKRIRLLHEKRQGVAYASQTALEASRAKYIARTDADDICKPTRIEKQFNFLETHPEYQAVGSMAEYVGPPENKGIQTFIDKTNSRITHKELSLNRFSELQIINPTLFFRKKTAETYGFYKHGNFPEDYEMFLRWMSKGVKFYKIPEKLIEWHDSPKRLTRTDSRYSVMAFYETKSPYIAEYSERHNPHHPNVVIWGAGRRSRRRAKLLEGYGLKIKFYIDINKTKEYSRYFETITHPGEFFILAYVGKRGADKLITNYLEEHGFQNGKDFLIVA